MGHIFDHNRSRYRLLLSDRGRFAAERKERRPGCSFRRSGQPDSVWSAGRGFGSFPGDDLVRDYFHAYIDYAFNFCGAANRAHICAFGSEANADEITARDASGAFHAAGHSAEPGADTEIETRPQLFSSAGEMQIPRSARDDNSYIV